MTTITRGAGTGDDGLLHWITREHHAERRLCDILEQIADGLPGPLDNTLTDVAVTSLRTCIKRHLALEEEYLYPMLRERAEPEDMAEDLLTQIATEHIADEGLAHETADQLEALERGRHGNAEMLGYMLRCLFVCRRRHIAWEDAVILPLASRRLLASDLGEFSATEFEKTYGSGASLITGLGPRRGSGNGNAEQ
jgi:hemerythrin-like domain-containing protein